MKTDGNYVVVNDGQVEAESSWYDAFSKTHFARFRYSGSLNIKKVDVSQPILDILSVAIRENYNLESIVTRESKRQINCLFSDRDMQNKFCIEMVLMLKTGNVNFRIGAIEREPCEGWAGLEEVSKFLNLLVPTKEAPEDNSLVPIRFWRYSQYGEACFYESNIACGDIDYFETNYPRISKDLLELSSLKNPCDDGHVILWHGPPGTGKTHAVRSLARQWYRNINASIEVIMDPETLFGNIGYFYELLLQGQDPYRRRAGQVDNDRTRLLIIEDSAELFADDCRRTPGFSRLLNISDGLIGQGLNVVFLLTANEKLDRFDDALLRTGRCLQIKHFDKLSKEEALSWMDKNGGNKDLLTEESYPLSDLYHYLKNQKDKVLPGDDGKKKFVGFGL